MTSDEKRTIVLRRRRRSLFIITGGHVPRCLCCGETETALLTIDHIAGGGT